VDRHLPTIAPSLKAGKDVYVEWPLGKSAAEARELLKLKNEGGVKSAVVGLQARQAPIIKQIKSLISSGKIGKVLSSTWTGVAGNDGYKLSEEFKYMANRAIGGNLVTIHFGHAVDYLQFVLGYGFAEPKAILQNRRPEVKLVDARGAVIEEKFAKTTDDTIFVSGILSTGIPVSMTLRAGKPFKGTPGLDWRIYGETGEIKVTAAGPFLQVGYPDMKIEVHDFEKDDVQEIVIEKDGWENLGGWGSANVARLYESLADGKINCTFEDAVKRHEFLEEINKLNGYVEGG
jgi:predicted dehydrogenase